MDNTNDLSILNFENSDLPAEARYFMITDMLKKHKCVVEFTKVNGETRVMPCTQMDEYMPAASQMLKEDVADVPPNLGLITVWDTENSAWRAMKTMNVISVKIAPKVWTITVEEDPETGDAILPFPEEFLKEAGWVEGDVLVWSDNNDGSWSLTKKE